MLKAILFDMDGVLVDSEPVHFKANYIMMKEKFNIELEYEHYKQFIGSTIEKIWKFYKDYYKLENYTWFELMDMAEKELADILEKDGYPHVDGAADLVKKLKLSGYKLAVASSSPMYKIKKNLNSLGITKCFDTLVSGMEIGKAKPEPDIFLAAAKALDVRPEECIVIEDSCNGVKAAKAANMACVGYINPNSGYQDLTKADYLIESFLNIDESFLRMVHNHCFNIPWKVMETRRLIIREMSTKDLDRLYEIYNNKEITKYTEDLFPDKQDELKYMEKYIKSIYKFYEYGMWIIETKDGKVIGRAGIEHINGINKEDNLLYGQLILNHENNESDGLQILGYVISKEYQNKGYGYEACKGIIEYAKEQLLLKKIVVKIHKQNKNSIKLAKKLGFIF